MLYRIIILFFLPGVTPLSLKAFETIRNNLFWCYYEREREREREKKKGPCLLSALFGIKKKKPNDWLTSNSVEWKMGLDINTYIDGRCRHHGQTLRNLRHHFEFWNVKFHRDKTVADIYIYIYIYIQTLRQKQDITQGQFFSRVKFVWI